MGNKLFILKLELKNICILLYIYKVFLDDWWNLKYISC